MSFTGIISSVKCCPDWRSALEKAASMRREERDKALAHVNGVFIRGLVGALHAMKPAKRLQTVRTR